MLIEDKEELEKDIWELCDELKDVRVENWRLMVENKELKLDI